MQKVMQAYFNATATTTSPGDVVIMLYDGAISFLERAKQKMIEKDYAQKGILISKAMDVIGELDSSLNIDKGGNLAENLHSLYFFCNTHLLQANLKMDTEKIDKVIAILTDLKDAFATIVNTPEAVQAAQTNSMSQRAQAPQVRMPVKNTPMPTSIGNARASSLYSKSSQAFTPSQGFGSSSAGPITQSLAQPAPTMAQTTNQTADQSVNQIPNQPTGQSSEQTVQASMSQPLSPTMTQGLTATTASATRIAQSATPPSGTAGELQSSVSSLPQQANIGGTSLPKTRAELGYTVSPTSVAPSTVAGQSFAPQENSADQQAKPSAQSLAHKTLGNPQGTDNLVGTASLSHTPHGLTPEGKSDHSKPLQHKINEETANQPSLVQAPAPQTQTPEAPTPPSRLESRFQGAALYKKFAQN